MLTLLIVLLFVGLMLISAGIGAAAAGATNFGIIFGVSGAVIVIIGVVILLVYRKRRAELQD
ncbi:hypothetical protein ACFLUG_00955 [Chloroflexota bacterium]